jgi:hypothetical protein
MAILFTKSIGTDQKPKATIQIDNGDLQAFENAMDQYGFIDQEALLRYALVALLNSSDNKLYIKNDGNIAAMKIADNLIKKEDKEKSM